MTSTTVSAPLTRNGTTSEEVSVSVAEVTPTVAERWLKQNRNNRHLTQKIVDTLAAAMLRGEWNDLNGDTIRFAADGTLLDGQHRLSAVVASGVTVRTLVVYGLEHESQLTMDAGRKRSFADHLKMRGESNYASLAALVARIYRWETGQVRSLNRPPTYAQLLAIYERPVDLNVSVKAALAVRRQLPVSAAVLGFAHYLFSTFDADDAAFFFDRLRDGQGLVEGDPLLALRKAILNSVAATRGRGRLDDVLLLALIIKTWNAFREGDQVKSLWWRSGGSRPEAFPEPV